MNGIDTTITGLINGELTLEDTRRRIAEILHQEPEISQQLDSYLRELFASETLPAASYKSLLELLESTAQSVAPDNDDNVAQLAPSDMADNDDVTVFAAASAHIDESATLVPPPDEEMATQISAAIATGTLPAGVIGPGAVLKGRFRLENRLGEGGMGVVYKAVDLLKVEARDRNPYVAIKVLTEAFKQHSDSFIALQREASKAQRLAHPNIATVFDFDRDSGNVFMTMELLEGVPLNTYIRQLPEGGLSEADAMLIIEDLGAGLAYAHRQGLVHSDFKPGNAFITHDGKIKVLDFGIARAAKHKLDEHVTHEGDEDKTVFDPTSLGALTPAYATVEMFEGKEPDPRDDIYALACVAYELLAGRHPFNKLSAPQARDKGLTVPLLTKLDKRQMRALQKALAFEREERTATVEEFLHGIKKRKDYTKQIVAGSVVGLLLIGAIAYKPTKTYFNNREAQRIAVEIQKGDASVIANTLAQFDQLDAEQRALITLAARDEIQSYFTNRINTAIDAENGHYDFPLAENDLKLAKQIYPDSAVLKEVEGRVVTQKSTLLAQLSERYSKSLETNALLPVKEQEDVTDSLDLIHQIDPNNALLSDPRLAIAYTVTVEKLIAADNFTRADEALNTAERYIHGDERLTDLHDRVRMELARIDYRSQLQQQQAALDALTAASSIEPFRSQGSLLALISSRVDSSDTARRVLDNLRRNSDEELNSLITRREFDRAETLLAELAPFMPTDTLILQRTRLSDAWNAAGRSAHPLPSQQPFDTIANAAEIDAARELEVLQAYRRSISAAGTKDERDTVIANGQKYYIARIDAMLQKHRFTEAHRLIEQSQLYNLPFQFRDTFNNKTVSAEKAYQIELEEKARQAAITGQKQMFTAHTQSNSIQKARELLQKLRTLLPENDPFLTNEAPAQLASAYGRIAEGDANRNNWAGAIENINEALRLNPTDEHLLASRHAYRKPWLTEQLEQSVLSSAPGSNERAARVLTEIRSDYADQYEQIITPATESLAKKIKATEATSLRQAHALKNAALALFGNNPQLQTIALKELPKDSEAAIRGTQQMESGQLTAAKASLAEALSKEASHEDVQFFKAALEQRIKEATDKFALFEKSYADADYDTARNRLNEAVAIWKDNSDFTSRKARFEFLMEKVNAGARLCRTSYSGYGNTGRATCLDLAGGTKAPLLVVIPASGRNPSPFAMSKYEVTVSEYNSYCSASKQCKPLQTSDNNLPATGLKPEQVEKYLQWLSHETGFTYRLPNRAEWKFAASAGGREGNSDYNCLLRIGTQTIKGQNMVAASLGQPNNWGLVNYVGNAEELVKDGDTYALAGASYRDIMSNCSTSALRNWSGDAAVAGFRLVRNIE